MVHNEEMCHRWERWEKMLGVGQCADKIVGVRVVIKPVFPHGGSVVEDRAPSG